MRRVAPATRCRYPKDKGSKWAGGNRESEGLPEWGRGERQRQKTFLRIGRIRRINPDGGLFGRPPDADGQDFQDLPVFLEIPSLIPTGESQPFQMLGLMEEGLTIP